MGDPDLSNGFADAGESDRLLAQTLSMQERGWLREQLAADFGDEWEAVRESGDPEQMKDFARRVLAWGQRFRSRSVTRYGEKLLADVEVAPLDLLLRSFDGIGDHLVLDRLAMLEPQGLHQALHAVGAEQAHEIVFQ